MRGILTSLSLREGEPGRARRLYFRAGALYFRRLRPEPPPRRAMSRPRGGAYRRKKRKHLLRGMADGGYLVMAEGYDCAICNLQSVFRSWGWGWG